MLPLVELQLCCWLITLLQAKEYKHLTASPFFSTLLSHSDLLFGASYHEFMNLTHSVSIIKLCVFSFSNETLLF